MALHDDSMMNIIMHYYYDKLFADLGRQTKTLRSHCQMHM